MVPKLNSHLSSMEDLPAAFYTIVRYQGEILSPYNTLKEWSGVSCNIHSLHIILGTLDG